MDLSIALVEYDSVNTSSSVILIHRGTASLRCTISGCRSSHSLSGSPHDSEDLDDTACLPPFCLHCYRCNLLDSSLSLPIESLDSESAFWHVQDFACQPPHGNVAIWPLIQEGKVNCKVNFLVFSSSSNIFLIFSSLISFILGLFLVPKLPPLCNNNLTSLLFGL